MKRIENKMNMLKRNNGNYLHQYLTFLGIDEQDIPHFLNAPEEKDYENPSGLINIDKAAEVYINALRNNRKIFVQVDSDADGYTSSSILIGYTKRRFKDANLEWRLHNGKEHGVIVDTVPSDTNIVVIPDAGSNQFEEHKALYDKGITTICLDHHELIDGLDINDTPAIIVNNQISPAFRNRNLSGAGVVLKFINFIDTTYFSTEEPIWQDYMDLAAAGIIGDAMNMRNLDNNYIALKGLKGVVNKFLLSLAEKQARGIADTKNLTKMDVMWYIVPVINGVIRSGSPEDKEMVFNAMINNDGDDTMFEHEWRGVVTMENLYQHAVRLAVNAKSRQDSNKKKSFEWICEKIKKEQLDKNNIIIVALDEKESSKVGANITGLIAMELVKEFNKPVLVLRKTTFEDVPCFGGSGRNGHFINLEDLKAEVSNAGAYYSAGHANAFGVFLQPDEIDKIVTYFNQNFNSDDFLDEVIEVDYWFHTGENIDRNMLMQFAKANYLYGNSIPEPKFAFDANISSSNFFAMGKDKASLKITIDGVDFVAFKSADTIAKLTQLTADDKTAHVQIVGKPSVNVWNGRESVQVIIDDIEIIQNQEITTVSVEDLI